MRSHNRLPEILAISSALALTGCTVSDNEPPTPPPSDAIIDTNTLTKYFRDSSLEDPCEPSILDAPRLDQQAKETQANACADIYKMGTVALVNYDVPLPVAENLASRTESLIRQATNDEITLDISVVEPSQLARDRLKAANPENCLDLTSNDSSILPRFSSIIANISMPDKLNDKDYVVGLTSAVECGTTDRHAGRQGLSIQALGNRFLEVLDADPAATHPTGEPFLDDAANLAHELLHNLGLGHAGKLTFPEGESPFGLEQTGPYLQQDIDLDALLAKSQYEEYGDSTNTQGNNATSYSDEQFPVLRLNNIQHERLRWPEYAKSPNQVRKEQLIGETDTQLNESDPESFASVQLATPIELIDSTTSPAPQQFTKLAIIPGEMNGIYQTELFLTNTTGDTARIGFITEMTPTWNISLGGKLISLNYTDTGLFAKATDQ